MENKKLIPLSDFVLEQKKKLGESQLISSILDTTQLIFNYAEFLKQPLKLEMFVPCDEDGNFLEKPADDDYSFYTHKNQSVQEEYQQAQEKVLFDGFEVSGNKITDGVNDVYYMGSCGKYRKHCLMGDNVEYLVNWNLLLTPSALKKIGIKE